MLSRPRILTSVCLIAIALAAQQPLAAPTPPAFESAHKALRKPWSPRSPDRHEWWKHAVLYEIYPRSFADSNGDGIGDLPGITHHLPYLHWLGVDAIWITPCFPSPQVDFGYDVSDYRTIDSPYGTLADMDRLIANARRRDIGVVLDLVLNHTSDQHPWFRQSESSRENAKRDWYIWSDGKRSGSPNLINAAGGAAPNSTPPPNNWTSLFGGSAWTYSPATQQFYYHTFYREQPDLNWRNPAVRRAMNDVLRYWYGRGVIGMRLDAITRLFKDGQLRDNPPDPHLAKNQYGDDNLLSTYTDLLPEVHDALRRMRSVNDSYPGRVLIGETWTDTEEQRRSYYGDQSDELQLAMNFFFMTTPRLSAPDFRKRIDDAEAAPGWPVWALSNHDMPRAYDRFAQAAQNEAERDAIAKLTAAMLLTLRGTPILYYGEEIGMSNNDPVRREDVKDPVGRRFWPADKGRDGERTPMQWSAAANAGFSRAAPWLPIPPSYATHNVTEESKSPRSILSWYRGLIRLRRRAALRDGKYISLLQNDLQVLAYRREDARESYTVLLNMGANPNQIALDLSGGEVVADNLAAEPFPCGGERASACAHVTGPITIQPYQALIVERSAAAAGPQVR